MIIKPESRHGVSLAIEALVEAGRPINLVLERGNITFERVLTPTGTSFDAGIILYKHIKNTYTSINKSGGKLYRLIDRKSMPDTSTINNTIYRTLKVLELSGYVLKQSTEWEVI